MAETKRQKLVPYEFVAPGFEGVYTGERSSSPAEETEIITVRATDDAGNVIVRWPVFTWTLPGQEKDWDDEIRSINEMQARLGPLDDDTRQIRAHIGSLVPCDSGLPVTVDELLNAIGRGKRANKKNAEHLPRPESRGKCPALCATGGGRPPI